MPTPKPHGRHPGSLEGVIDPTVPLQFSSVLRQQLKLIFHSVIEACEPRQDNIGPYKQVTLVRLTYEYARSDASKDDFLHFFFRHTGIPTDAATWEAVRHSDYKSQLAAFADSLVENFFLPLKASTRKTPQPSPTKLSDAQSTHSPIGTTQRVATLRRECLIRDHHRCVISHTFDDAEATRRVSRDGEEMAKDDDGNLLRDEGGTFAPLEVAHILPHSLMTVQSATAELDESKAIALAILNMFDHGVLLLIEGTDVDRPRNAITLTHDFHQLFGNFEVYFEPCGNEPHTYRIDSTRSGIVRHRIFPVDRTLFLTETKMIDPPSPRLLAVHRAITHILHLSAAGRYIDDILDSLNQKTVEADGSTELGYLAQLRLRGWWNGQIQAY